MKKTLETFAELGKVKRRLVKGKTMFLIERSDGRTSFAVYRSHDDTELITATGECLPLNAVNSHLTKVTVISPEEAVFKLNTAVICLWDLLSTDLD